MKKVIKNNYKIIIGFIIGLLFSITTVYAIDAYIESNKVAYNNHNKTNVEEAIDELYERSGIHKTKWVDPVLNGADPVLKEPLIPVEIKNNGDVYYASLNSEWYNYSEKRWANAVILTDSAKTYKVGDKISDSDIKGYFVWIPRYQYIIWDEGKYNNLIDYSQLTDIKENPTVETALWRITGNKNKLIKIKFGNVEKAPKMNESEAILNKYYTHPAFTLGDKDLNGIWVGKFETGITNIIVVKPNVNSMRSPAVKGLFDTAKDFDNTLDSHMMKNTEWGAVAYLSHSQYGAGRVVNVNNASDFVTGYSATLETNQDIMPGESGLSSDSTKTQPWNTPVGYLASTTGNISGIYDMNGGVGEMMAGYSQNAGDRSGFSSEEILTQIKEGYIDEYSADSSITDHTSYDKRILGDATGELGPFYSYFDINGNALPRSNWYGSFSAFIDPVGYWFVRGGNYASGSIGGQFNFDRNSGIGSGDVGMRLILAPIK